MQKFSIIALILLVFSCKNTDKQETKETTKDFAQTKTEQKPTIVEEKPDYTKLIQGRWVLPSPKEKFEPWAYYDTKKVHGDGYEEGVTYEIKGDVILYPEAQSEVKILRMTEKEMVLQLQDGSKETWIKADFEKETESQAQTFDSKLLIGVWNLKGGDEFTSLRFKKNGRVDMIPFNDLYNYKVEGNFISYKKSEEAPEGTINTFKEEIIKLTAKELILKAKGKESVYSKGK